MKLYFQMGYGMQAMILDLLNEWGDGDVILSPVNIDPKSLQGFSENVKNAGGRLLFDPQMFYPSTGHVKLQRYPYWPTKGASIVKGGEYSRIDQELLRINKSLDTEAVILPGDQIDELNTEHSLKWMVKSAEYFRNKTEKPIYATLCLDPERVRNLIFIEKFISLLEHIDVDGYYVVTQHPNGEYIVEDQLWMTGALKLVTCLKTMGKKVIAGYSNHQNLVFALSKVDAIASGNYLNTRSFMPDKFKTPRENTPKQKSTWYYNPNSFSEYQIPQLDVAYQFNHLSDFEPQTNYKNKYSDVLFRGATPTSTNYREKDSFRHYLYCLREQCKVLSKDTYKEAFDMYEFMLNAADAKMKAIKAYGLTGRQRDFAGAVEANRVAMYYINDNYRLKLNFEWGRM